MKIGVIGAGAIGGFYGLMLARAGHEVHFVLRGDFDAVQRDGMQLKSTLCGDYRLPEPSVFRSIAELPPCDVLIVAAKTTSNAELAPQVAQAAVPGASVLLLQNGFGVEETYRRHLDETVHLLGGLCMISVHREAAGLVAHHGLGSINMGYHSGPATDPGSFLQSSFVRPWADAQIELVAMPDLIGARWQKLLLNIPFNGLTVLLGCGTRPIVECQETQRLLRQIMEEVEAAALACGHPLPANYLEECWQRSLTQPNYSSSMQVDYQHRRALELDAIYRAPLEAARSRGCNMPAVDVLYRSLVFLDQQNRHTGL